MWVCDLLRTSYSSGLQGISVGQCFLLKGISVGQCFALKGINVDQCFVLQTVITQGPLEGVRT